MITTANIKLDGKDSGFSKILEESIGNFSKLDKEVLKVNKTFSTFSKDTKKTTGLFETFGENVTKTTKGLGGFTKESIIFGRNVKSNSETLIAANDALDNATSGLTGFGLKITGTSKSVNFFNDIIAEPAGHLRDIADASSGTERAFILLDKAKKPLLIGLDKLSKAAKTSSIFFQDLETNLSKGFGQVLVMGARSTEIFTDSLSNLQKSLKGTGFLGNIISNQLGGVVEGLEKGSKVTKEFGKEVQGIKFNNLKSTGDTLANAFERAGVSFEKSKLGVIIADLTGDIYRAGLGIKGFVEESLIPAGAMLAPIAAQFLGFAKAPETLEQKLNLFGQKTNQVNGILQNATLKVLAEWALKIGSVIAAYKTLESLIGTVSNITMSLSGMNDGFEIFKSLGIDTYAAETTLQLGLMGENLILNGEAAKSFAKSAVTAFSKFEDQAAFVTTLSAGAKAQFEGYEQGIESISAATTKLVNGPLKNAVTAGEVTTAMYNALSAGIGVARDGTVNLASTNQFLEASLKLSSATATDSAQALETLFKVSNVYGRSNIEAAKTATQLYAIVEEGITTFPQLAGGLSRTASQAKASGISLEEMGGSIAALTKVMTTDDTLTGYSSLLNAIAGQGEGSAKAVQELGIRFDGQSVKAKGLLESLKDLQAATNGNQEMLKRIIPDSLAFTTALNLMTTSSSEASRVMNSMKESGDKGAESLDNLFNNRRATIIQRSTALMSGFTEVIRSYGEAVMPVLGPAISVLEKILTIFQEMPTPLKMIAGGLMLFHVVIGRAMEGGMAFLGFFGKLYLTMVTSNLMMKAFNRTLGNEFEALKQIVLVEKDVFGALVRLTGKTTNYSNATISLTKAKQAAYEVERKYQTLKERGLDDKSELTTVGGLQESYRNAAKMAQKQIDELKKSGLNVVDPEGFKQDLKALEDFRKSAEKEARLIGDAQRQATAEFGQSLNQMIAIPTESITEKQKEITRRLGITFNSFGQMGERLRETLIPDIESVLEDVALTSREKGLKIAAYLKETASKAAPSVARELDKMALYYQNSFNAIELNAGVFNSRVKGSFLSLVGALKIDDSLKTNLINSFDQTFKGLSANVTERSEQIVGLFGTIFSNLPAELADVSPRLQGAVNALLNDSETPFQTRKANFEKLMAEALQGLSGPVAQQTRAIASQMFMLAQNMELPFNGLDVRLEAQMVTTMDRIKNAVTNLTIDNASLADVRFVILKELDRTDIGVKEKLKNINHDLSIIAQNSGPTIRANLKELQNSAELQLGIITEASEVKVKELNSKLETMGLPAIPVVRQTLTELGSTAAQGIQEVTNKVTAKSADIYRGLISSSLSAQFATGDLVEVLNDVAELQNGELNQLSLDLLSDTLAEEVNKGVVSVEQLSLALDDLGDSGNEGVNNFVQKVKGDLVELATSTSRAMDEVAEELAGADSEEKFQGVANKIGGMLDKAPDYIKEDLKTLIAALEAEQERIKQIRVEGGDPNAAPQTAESEALVARVRQRSGEVQESLKSTAAIAVKTASTVEKSIVSNSVKMSDVATKASNKLSSVADGANNLLQAGAMFFGLPVDGLVNLTNTVQHFGLTATQGAETMANLTESSGLLSFETNKTSKGIRKETAAFNENRKTKGLNSALNLVLMAQVGSLSEIIDVLTFKKALNTTGEGQNTLAIRVNTAAKLQNVQATNADIAATSADTATTLANNAANMSGSAGTAKAMDRVKKAGHAALLFLAAPLTQLKKAWPFIKKTFEGIFKFFKGGAKFLGPVTTTISIAVGLFALLRLGVLNNIPGVNLLTDKYARFGRTLEKNAEKIREINKEMQGLKETEEEVSEVPEKAQAEGLLGTVMNLGEGFVMGANRVNSFVKSASKEDTATEQTMIRNYFNGLRENVQASLTTNAREGEQKNMTETMSLLSNAAIKSNVRQEGNITSEAGKAIRDAAGKEGRSLTGEELTKIQEEERKAIEVEKKALQDLMLVKEKELETAIKMKDEDMIARREQEIETIGRQTAATEEAGKSLERFLNNIQTFTTTLDLNDAGKGMEGLAKTTQTLVNSPEFNNLSDTLKQEYLDLAGIKTEVVSLVDGEKSREEILELTGMTEEALAALEAQGVKAVNIVNGFTGNINNASQRRTQQQANAALSAVKSLAGNIGDSQKTITLDTAQAQIDSGFQAITDLYESNIIDYETFLKKRKELGETAFEVDDNVQDSNLKRMDGMAVRDVMSITARSEMFEEDLNFAKEHSDKIIARKTNEIEVINNLVKLGQKTQVEAVTETATINGEINQQNIAAKKQEIAFLNGPEGPGPQSVRSKKAVRELALLEQQATISKLEGIKQVADAKDAAFQREVAQEKLKISGINLQEQKGNLTKVEALQQVSDLEAEIDRRTLENKKANLTNLKAELGDNAEEVKALELEIAQFSKETEVKRFQEKKAIIEAELELLQKKLAVEVQLAKNVETVSSNRNTLIKEAMDLEKAALDSNINLNKALSELQQSTLQNRVKMTTNLEQKALLELQIAKDRQVILNREAESEQLNLEIQQKMIAIGHDREESQLRISALEASTAKKTIQIQLSKQKELGLKKEEIDLLNAQLEAQDLQIGFIADQRAQLDEVRDQQIDINANEQEALNLRRQARVEAAAIDAELAARDAVIAKYEQEKREVNLRVEIEQAGSEARIKSLENQSNLLEAQVSLMEKQKGLIDAMSASVQASYNLALQSERNEFRKRRIQREAAILQLETMRRQQEFEKFSFELQIQQKDLALERQRIEIEIAKAKGQADLALARAEEQQALADPRTTALEREAAAARVRAQEINLAGLDQQSSLVNQQGILERATRGQERQQFERAQRDAILQQEGNIAATTLRRSDDRQVGRRALRIARDDAQQLPQTISQLTEQLKTLVSRPSTIGSSLTDSVTGTRAAKQKNELTGEVTLNMNLDVRGDTSGLDMSSTTSKVNMAVGNAVEQLFEGIRVRSKV